MSAETRLDIMDLLARYAWAYDCADADAYVSVFTPDGILADTGDLFAQGADAIRRSIVDILEVRGGDTWQHYHDQLLIRGDDERCTVDCYWMVVALKNGEHPPIPLAAGYCHNDCVRLDGRWYLQSRRFGYGLPAAKPAEWAA